MKLFQKIAISVLMFVLSAVGASAQCTVVPNTSNYAVNSTDTPNSNANNPWSISGSGLGVEPLVYLFKQTWESNGLSLGYNAAVQPTATTGENFVRNTELLSLSGGTTPTTGIYFDSDLGYVEVLVTPTPSQSGQYSVQIALYHRPYVLSYHGPAGYQLVSASGPTNLTLPVYIQMTKSGLSFTGATSTDGINYTSFGTVSYTQGAFVNTTNVGLVAYSGDNITNSVTTASFQNDQISDNDTGNVFAASSMVDENLGTAATNGNTALEFGQPTANLGLTIALTGQTTFSFPGCSPSQIQTYTSEINSSTVQATLTTDFDYTQPTADAGIVRDSPTVEFQMSSNFNVYENLTFANLVGFATTGGGINAEFTAFNSSGQPWLSWSSIWNTSGNFIFEMEEAFTMGQVTLVQPPIYSQVPYCTMSTTPPDFNPQTFVIGGPGPYQFALGGSVCVSSSVLSHGWHCTPGPAYGFNFSPPRFQCTKNTPPY